MRWTLMNSQGYKVKENELLSFHGKGNNMTLKPRANGRNIVGCYLLRPFAHPVACCWMLLRKV